ncbi:MAG: cyclase family protein [Calditrichaeota bacterium]|nr:cyclase family protein [Calditrichota bacterium]
MDLQNYRIVDLTHPISEKMPHWPGDPKTVIRRVANFGHHGFNLNRVAIGEHSGTHIGAAKHFVANGADVSAIPAESLISKAFKLDFSEPALQDRDFLISRNHILQWEEKFTTIESHSLVLLQTGWSRFWQNSEHYFGSEKERMHFPGIALDAAKFLAKERQIIGIGIDSPGIDGGLAKDFAANRFLAEHGVFHLENLNRLESLDCCDNLVFIGALPIENGSGSPCRVLGLVQKSG